VPEIINNEDEDDDSDEYEPSIKVMDVDKGKGKKKERTQKDGKRLRNKPENTRKLREKACKRCVRLEQVCYSQVTGLACFPCAMMKMRCDEVEVEGKRKDQGQLNLPLNRRRNHRPESHSLQPRRTVHRPNLRIQRNVGRRLPLLKNPVRNVGRQERNQPTDIFLPRTDIAALTPNLTTNVGREVPPLRNLMRNVGRQR